MKRATVVPATALALAVAVGAGACGSGATGPGSAGSVPSRASTSLTPATGTETTDVALYFTKGERVEKVTRAVPKVPRIGAEAVKALVAGPNEAERQAGLATAIPAGTQFKGLTIDNEVARVDLSRAFESGGGLGLLLRLAQVACTLDAFPTVSGVRFALDGQLVDVLSGDGVLVDQPVTCETYAEYVGGGSGPVPAATFAGIWPFATAAELDRYAAGTDQTFRDPSSTARAFADQYLRITNPAVFPFQSTGAGAGEVPVGFRTGEGGSLLASPRPTTVVQVRQLGRPGPGEPWTVVGATSPDIEVDGPAPSDKVTSPVSLTGRARAFEGTVTVEVREDGMVAGQSLGSGFVTGRGDGVLGPFSGRVTFRAPTKPAGAVLFYEKSMADGGSPVLRAAVVRVRFT